MLHKTQVMLTPGFRGLVVLLFALWLLHGSIARVPVQGAAPPPTAAEIPVAANREAAQRDNVRLEGDSFNGVAFSRDGKKLLTVGIWEAQVWDTATWKPIGQSFVHGERLTTDGYREKSRPRVGESIIHKDELRKGELDAAGKRVLTVALGEAMVWDMESGKAVGPAIRHGNDPATDAAISPDGAFVVTCNSASSIAHLWNLATGKLERSFDHKKRIAIVQFDREGTTLITTGAATQLWTVKTGDMRLYIQAGIDSQNVKPSLSHNGRIATASEGGFSVHDIDTGKLILHDDSLIHLDCQVHGVWISPDGSWVAASSTLNSGIWEVKSGEQIVKTINSFDAAFDPASASVVLLALEDSWGVRDIRADRRVRRFDKRDIYISHAAFTSDGGMLAHQGLHCTRVIFARPGVSSPQRWTQMPEQTPAK